ncbi:MAG: hypothetical protein ACI9KE_005602 [Polyangiales bacterium]|jgi:hypothetical protein
MRSASPIRSERFEDDKGYATLESDASGVVRFAAVGHYSLALSIQASDAMTELARLGLRFHVFSDFSKMATYASASRSHATAWCRENFRTIESVHILTRPGLVAMGVATAAMTLSLIGLEMKAYTDPVLFQEAFRRTKRDASRSA